MSVNKTTHALTQTIEAKIQRRRFTPEQKHAMVMQTYSPGASVSAVARNHGIAPSQLYQWRHAMEQGAITGIIHQEKVVSESELKAAQKRCKELLRLVGTQAEKIEILEAALELAGKKKLVSRSSWQGMENGPKEK